MPQNWPPPKEKWFAGFSAHRDGWVRSYRGRTLACGGRYSTIREVESNWERKKRECDARLAGIAGPKTYRLVLSEFLAVQEARLGSKRRPLSERMFHNYEIELNRFGKFDHDGVKTADRLLDGIGPAVFSAFARKHSHWSASAFDSVVTRVSTLFKWAEGQEYIARFRPGPEFRRPAKAEIRDERIDLEKSFTPEQIARLWLGGGPGSYARCSVGLGVCAGFINTDIGHVTREVLGVDSAIIDFRRRKQGKVRRVVPLPADLHAELRAYSRPEPTDPKWSDLFFLTVVGQPYTRSRSKGGEYKPSDSVSRMFRKHCVSADVSTVAGQNFTGLRTTLYNLWPKSGYDRERDIVMGHARGTIGLDHYLEDVGVARLAHGVNYVWAQIKSEIDRISSERACAVQPAAPALATVAVA